MANRARSAALTAMVDPFIRVMRWRLIEQLVETASPADVLIQMVDEGHFRYEDLAQRFWDWWAFVPTLDAGGAMSAETILAVSKVNDGFVALDRLSTQAADGSGYPWTADALQHSPDWQAVRRAAREALEAFGRMGLPAPSLTDADFNKPRSDAP
jgi:hypothetical protein